MSNKVSGIVEGVGDKFNGSLKIQGVWYSNKKGFKNPAKVGDNITLTLKEWEFNGKKGVNVSDVFFNTPEPEEAPQKAVETIVLSNLDSKTVAEVLLPSKNQGTDWAAKDRSQLVGGRSHDAVELVKAALQTAVPIEKVLKMYETVLKDVLEISDRVK